MQNQSKMLIGIVSTFLLFSCTSADYYSDYNEDVDFRSYKSYTICMENIEVEYKDHPMYDNEFNRNRIKKAIISEMDKLGYQRDDLNPELQAGFQIVIEDRQVTATNCYNYRTYGYWPECRVNTYIYTEGSIVIHVSDINKGQVIWQGGVYGNLNIAPDKIKKVIDKTVAQIFESYPLNLNKDQDFDLYQDPHPEFEIQYDTAEANITY